MNTRVCMRAVLLVVGTKRAGP